MSQADTFSPEIGLVFTFKIVIPYIKPWQYNTIWFASFNFSSKWSVCHIVRICFQLVHLLVHIWLKWYNHCRLWNFYILGWCDSRAPGTYFSAGYLLLTLHVSWPYMCAGSVKTVPEYVVKDNDLQPPIDGIGSGSGYSQKKQFLKPMMTQLNDVWYASKVFHTFAVIILY